MGCKRWFLLLLPSDVMFLFLVLITQWPGREISILSSPGRLGAPECACGSCPGRPHPDAPPNDIPPRKNNIIVLCDNVILVQQSYVGTSRDGGEHRARRRRGWRGFVGGTSNYPSMFLAPRIYMFCTCDLLPLNQNSTSSWKPNVGDSNSA
jgi:hypothetical protein